MIRAVLIAATFLLLAAASTPAMADDAAETVIQQEETLQALARENALLKEKLRSLECAPAITCDALAQKNLQTLREIARNTKNQRQAMADFEGFVKWMATNLSGYAKYVQAGSVAAGFAKVLPIPYAGQASVLTKFASQGVLSLNAASLSINRYLDTSQQFVAKVEALDPAKPATPAEISELARFADGELLRDMTDVQQKLAATAEISASALSFLESLNAYLGSTDEYWNKTKSLLSRKEADKKEKSYLSESIQHLRDGAGNFNARLKAFDETARKAGPLIKSVVAYDELVRELGMKTAQAKN
ncbi:MAG: hypothetical protein NDI77_14010 [Geobacteraceae bacterium]|nr:hypothetical protein [Geobacteraceae bacterium]